MKTNKEIKKVILLARVSTVQQNYDEQINEIKRAAIADGYKESEIVVIKGKESAIKLAEEERATLNEMKEIISDYPTIESIYVFAIDRLARRVSVVLSVKDYLLERKINLVFIHPHKLSTIRINDKGERVEDELTGMMLMFLAYGAEMEMKIKQARFKAGKALAKEQGKWTGTPVMFGYKIVNQREVIDEIAAEVIRNAYQMYVGDENRTAQTNVDIATYLRNNGICKRSDKFFSAGRVASFIAREKYRGTIVSEELWDKCNEIRLKNYNGSKERKMAFAERLIKCPDCGRNYQLSHRSYICAAHKSEYKDSDMYCENRIALHRRFVDCSLVETVAVWWLEEQKKDNSERKQQTQQSIDKLSARLADAQSKLDKVSEKKKRIGKNYANMILTDEEFDKAIKTANVEEKQLKSDVANISARISELQSELADYSELKTWSQQWQSFNSLTHAEMYEVIHRLVSHISIRVEDGKKFWTIHRKDSSDEVTYMIFGYGRAVKLYGYVNGKAVELTKNPDFNVDYDKDSEMKDAA